jgi:hypothetical protein
MASDTKYMLARYDGKCGFCGSKIMAGGAIEYDYTTRKVTGCAYCDKQVKTAYGDLRDAEDRREAIERRRSDAMLTPQQRHRIAQTEAAFREIPDDDGEFDHEDTDHIRQTIKAAKNYKRNYGC